jgi:hypothetical protein
LVVSIGLVLVELCDLGVDGNKFRPRLFAGVVIDAICEERYQEG